MVETTGENIEAEMIELSKIMNSESFKTKQQEFFVENCDKFDAEEENKLCYTTIHKAYEELVES